MAFWFRTKNKKISQKKRGIMNSGSLKACAYLGVFALILMFIGVGPLMRMFPPLDPALNAAQVASHYREHATAVIMGGILVMTSSIMVMPFLGVLSVFMKKMEGEHSPLTYTFIGLSGFAFVTLFICGLTFSLAAYRPEASDETIRAISDFSIFMMVLPDLIFAGQAALLGAAILTDQRDQPVFPRWIGYLQLFSALVSLPGGLIALFKSGPFAWNGALAFWMPMALFAIWVGVMLWAFFDALKRKVLEAP